MGLKIYFLFYYALEHALVHKMKKSILPHTAIIMRIVIM